MMSLVWEYYPAGGGELLVALSYADHAHDDGTGIRPSVPYTAEKTRQSKRAVQMHLAKMRETRWLLTVRYSAGGRGRATEYRINPNWIENPANFSPFFASHSDQQSGTKKDADISPISKLERVQLRTEKGEKSDSKGCKAFAPQPSRTGIEPTTTLKANQNRVIVDDLTWPSSLNKEAIKESASLLLNHCPGEYQQLILDEIAGLAMRGTVRHPIGLLRALIEAACQGTFVPAAALEFHEQQVKKKKAAERTNRDKERRRVESSPQAKRCNQQQLSAIRKSLKGNNSNGTNHRRKNSSSRA
ncbi:MAG: hypothetical protein KZQ99_14420 [Candidatus Thiodiazotropha sp. (ex Dulcina madagascariensis)]|nr:hypothetical protein [Candidatus Thiodiazotropha sp. (ex Dulcina madagascariensis)]